MLNRCIGLDFETYSACDLTVHGLERYVQDPTFTPLIAATYTEDDLGNRSYVGEYDFITDPAAKYRLFEDLQGFTIVAHNADFERRVLMAMGKVLPADRFICSAILSRSAGASGHLEGAAPQLLGVPKLESGKNLIKLFSIPSEEQIETGQLHFDEGLVHKYPDEWREFMLYCKSDARLGYRLAEEIVGRLTPRELEYSRITMDMNVTGWPTDVATVEEMQRRYLENQARALEEFRSMGYDGVEDLNLNSHPQQVKWCADRGINARSFDKDHVEKLIKRLDKKLSDPAFDKDPKRDGYYQVLHLMQTKQILGGATLRKLKTILDTQHNGRLRDQYFHCGAPQTWRTTGRSAQMQNLKRIGENPDDMSELEDEDVEWDNDQLALNIRQVFTSSRPDGRLIVGDLKSVESRGLAWWAGEEWKLDAYRKNQDLYLVQASKIYGVDITDKKDPRRMTGKVGELSCGYQAAGGAVRSFAAGMGVDLTEAEAASIVSGWRDANPKIVAFWWELDSMLHTALEQGASPWYQGKDGFKVRITEVATPGSLLALHKNAQTLMLEVIDGLGTPFLRRYFHGCYERGRDICYYKPTDRKTGDVWKRTYVHPKTGQEEYYKIYGGKLAGILVQSFCREIFMHCLSDVSRWVNAHHNVDLIGQFHDEIVLDWHPEPTGYGVRLDPTKKALEELMSRFPTAPSFPLGADIKDDYRYTK